MVGGSRVNVRHAILTLYRQVAQPFSGRRLRRVPILNWLHEFILSSLKSTTAHVHGHRMTLDPTDALRLSLDEVHEALAAKLVKQTIRPGDIVLDIGANIGYYTLIFAKLTGKQGKVFAFEPIPNNFALLKKNVEENGYDNVILINQPVSDRGEKIKFYLSQDPTMHRLYPFPGNKAEVELDAIRLDEFQPLLQTIDFMKIDVVGAEWKVLQGASMIIKANPRLTIMTGFWPAGFRQAGFSPEAYLKFLEEQGFVIYWINETEKKAEAIQISPFMARFEGKDDEDVNLWCTRSPLV